MSKTVKSCDLSIRIAAKVFELLNPGKVKIAFEGKVMPSEFDIITDEEPKNLVYPEGWYYAKGCFRNKHTSTTGVYSEAFMFKSNNELWGDSAKYCTLDV